MTRLSDEELRQLAHLNETAGAVWSPSKHALRALLEEVSERRAADLSSEDREALIDAQRCIRFHCNKNDKHHVAALAVLSKVLTQMERTRG